MKRNTAILAALFAIASSGTVCAQETESGPHPHYEKMKVLEPLIGTFRVDWTRSDGGKMEFEATFSWTGNKRMIQRTTKIRNVDEDWQDWRERGLREFYYWNAEAEHIERVVARPGRGVLLIQKVEPKGNGEFSVVSLFANVSSRQRSDESFTITEAGIALHQTNRIDREGQPQADQEFSWTRIETSADDNDDEWEAKEWAKLVGNWRSPGLRGGHRIKRITEGQEILEVYNDDGKLVRTGTSQMRIERRHGLNFFTVSSKTRQPYTSIYKVHDGKWYEQLRGMFASGPFSRGAPNTFLIYERVE